MWKTLLRLCEGLKWVHVSGVNTLKELVSSAPALNPIDYSSDHAIVLSVDTSCGNYSITA